MLLDGPARPMAAYASVDYSDDEYDGGFDDFEDYSDFDDPEPDPEPEYTPAPARPEVTDVERQYQPKIDNINDRLAGLAMEKTQIERSITSARSEKEKEQANKTYIDRQIAITQTEIELLLERIGVLEDEIEAKIEAIDNKQAEYEDSYDQFLLRLRAMQLNGDATQIGAVLGSASFADYLSTNEMMSRVADYDQKLMARVKREHRVLELERADLVAIKEEVEADREETEDKKKTLAAQQQSALLKIQSLAEMETQYLADLATNQRLSKEMETELQRIFKEIELSKNPYVGGEMGWPVPGYFQISSHYGLRFGGKDFHQGMDIAGSNIHGKPIVAANDGVVAHVNYAYTAGRGYGIFLIIDHGGKVTTLYAHCSSISVSVGQEVKRGQEIAKVGNTGWSTGPHLHFEVRENGVAKNPINYVRS